MAFKVTTDRRGEPYVNDAPSGRIVVGDRLVLVHRRFLRQRRLVQFASTDTPAPAGYGATAALTSPCSAPPQPTGSS